MLLLFSITVILWALGWLLLQKLNKPATEQPQALNKGSIYGVVSDRFKNLAFKAPKQITKYPNLFFVGGTVNPGGGMPMVVLCGQNVAKKVVEWESGKAARS